MSCRLDHAIIQQKALQVLEEYQIKKIPIDPKLIAQKANIQVEAKNDTGEGVSGMLLRSGNNFGILYSTYLNNPGFENFCIAHELGHYFLAQHHEQIFKTGNIHISKAEFTTSDPIEREADTFAASLLMPETFFMDQMIQYEKGLDCIESMAKLCNTSLISTAIRYAELSQDKVVVIVSTNGIIDYCFISNAVFKLEGIEKPQKGMRIPKGSATEYLVNNPALITKSEKRFIETDFRDWLECRKSKQAAEEVKGLGKYGKVLTVIS
jgi:Zn-dependent peptidase ImmA (M78 family)